MNQYRIRLRGRTFDVRVLSDPQAKEVQVEVNGESLAVAVEALPEASPAPPVESHRFPSHETATGARPEAAAAPSNVVTAPLPGVIKTVSVRPGEAVEPGQVLMVIEAMKMDNLLRSARAGVIELVHVSPGRQVAHGEPLLAFQDS